mgnify:CR=1 FL=1
MEAWWVDPASRRRGTGATERGGTGAATALRSACARQAPGLGGRQCDVDSRGSRPSPRRLDVRALAGHATLLRGTVEAFLANHDVYITDWVDARMVPAAQGRFDLDDYIDYVINILHFLGGDTHVVAVCQPSVPVLAATALMEAADDHYAPRSITLMGGPIDTRINPTAVNKLAEQRGIDWFRRNVITKVPFPHQIGRAHV